MLALVYVTLFNILGALVASILFGIAGAMILSRNARPATVITMAVIPIAIVVVMQVVMQQPLPEGFLDPLFS